MKGQQDNSCRHHWILTPSSGSNETTGRCKNCGKVKTFFMSLPSYAHNGYGRKNPAWRQIS